MPMPFFSSIRREGEWAFVSGQMALDDSMRISGADVAEQTRVCLARIEAILATEKLSLRHVVKATVWLQRVEDFSAFNTTYEAVFRDASARAPTRSTVRADLMIPDALVEIEVMARAA